MKKLLLNSTFEMPILGLGTWKSEKGKVYDAIRTAIYLGYRHFDCASAYGNETEIGSALNDALKEGDVSRQELFITSKLWNDSHAPEDVRPALEKTLEDLKLDYLDLYLMHWPVALKKGTIANITPESLISLKDMPLSETWKEMEKATMEAGGNLIRSIGVSNFSIKKLEEMKDYATIMPAVNQVESHPFLAQNKLIEYAKSNNIAITAYAPLASRDRPDKLKSTDEPALVEHPVIEAIAAKHCASPAQVLIAWHINRGVSVIPKSVSPQRLAQNFESRDLKLDKDDMTEIAKLDRGYRYVTSKAFECASKGYTEESIWDEQ